MTKINTIELHEFKFEAKNKYATEPQRETDYEIPTI